jgi:hypothetical protein
VTRKHGNGAQPYAGLEYGAEVRLLFCAFCFRDQIIPSSSLLGVDVASFGDLFAENE